MPPMNDTVIPLAVPGSLRSQIVEAAKAVSLTQAQVMRQSIRLGLPQVLAGLAIPSGAAPKQTVRPRK